MITFIALLTYFITNMSNEFHQFKEFAGHAEVNSLDYSGKQKLRGE